MAKAVTKRISTGKVLLGAGLLAKVLQLILSACGVAAAGAALPTVITACLIVGGLAVLALEWRGITMLLAIMCAVFWMASLLFARSASMLGTVAYFAAYFTFIIMLFTMRLGILRICTAVAAAVLLTVMIVYLCGALALSGTGAAAMLCAVHVLVFIGLFA